MPHSYTSIASLLATDPSHDIGRFLLLYGSQTGQAKAIAEEIEANAPFYGLQADLHCLSQFDRKFNIKEETCVVFIVSTSGDGEPPDSALKFVRRVFCPTLDKGHLSHLNCTLLALGDSNYPKFALFGWYVEQQLKFLSANFFHPVGYADDAMGIETVADQWMQSLWPALQRLLNVPIQGIPNDQLLAASSDDMSSLFKILEDASLEDLDVLLRKVEADNLHFPNLPRPALNVEFETQKVYETLFLPTDRIIHSKASDLAMIRLTSGRKMTHGDDVKKVLELSFKFENTSIPYDPGDSFGFLCQNSLEDVEIILHRLNLSHFSNAAISMAICEDWQSKKKLPSHIPNHLTLKEAFLNCVDIRSVPKKILLRVCAEYTSNHLEKKSLLYLSSREGSMVYTNCVIKHSLCILDILMKYKSCMPPIGVLLEHLPCLKPRFYSVTSTSLDDPTEFKILFNIIEMDKKHGRWKDKIGVCTGWFNLMFEGISKKTSSDVVENIAAMSINPENPIYVYKRTNHHFTLQEHLNLPVIMVGPGTGIAPFISLLKHRDTLVKRNRDSKLGPAWLFYGCRYKGKDYLYRDELQQFLASGALTHLVVAHSREDLPPKDTTTFRYVQEGIVAHSGVFGSAVDDGGYIYVCGDAHNMAKDVEKAFVEVFRNTRRCTESAAGAYVQWLQKEHRYVNDIW